jgi:hypothetical protein
MTRELDSTESQIKDKVNQLLEGLQVLAKTSNELNLHSLVTELEELSLQLSCDSKLISANEIKKLYETVVVNVEMLHTTLIDIENKV